MAQEVLCSNPAGSHQFLKPGPINFKDPPYFEEMESGEEMESRERRWKAKVRLADLMRPYSAYKMCKTIVF